MTGLLFSRRALGPLALSALLTLPAAAGAQQQPSWFDMFRPGRLAERAVQFAVTALRTQVDVTYEAISTNMLSRRISLSNVLLWPEPPWDRAGACVVSVDQIVLRSAPVDEPDMLSARAQFMGLEVAPACLPPPAQTQLRSLALDTLRLPRLTANLDYRIGTAEAALHVFGEAEDMAALALNADFSYLALAAPQGLDRTPVPRAYLRRAQLRLENLGGWSRIAPQLPPMMTAPEAAAPMLEGMLSAALLGMNFDAAAGGPAPDTGGLSPEQEDFVADVARAVPEFLAAPGSLVLETGFDPGADRELTAEVLAGDPRAVFAVLQPRVALRSSQQRDLLPAAALRQMLDGDPAALALPERRRLGLALASGRGAPRNPTLARALLDDLAMEGDGDAAEALARALVTDSPEDAYRYALVAGGAGIRRAAVMLDRLESRLGLAAVLKLQFELSGGADEFDVQDPGGIAQMRSRAAAHHSGRGALRSYELAALWATLAAAGGDTEAADILTEITDSVRLAGADASRAWAPRMARVRDAAMRIWVRQNLPGRLGSER